MALTKSTFSGANGAVVTTANSGFSAVSKTDTAGTYDFSNAWNPRGIPNSIRAIKTTTSGQIYSTIVISATDTLTYDQPFRADVLPNAAGDVGLFWAGAGSTRSIAVTYNLNGAVRLQDAAGFIWISSNGIIQANRPVIISVAATRSSTAGTLRVVIYHADTLAVLADSGLFTGRNTGAAGYTHIRTSGAGTGSGTIPMTHRWGEPRWDTASSTLLDPDTSHHPAWDWDVPTQTYVKIYPWEWDVATSTYVRIPD